MTRQLDKPIAHLSLAPYNRFAEEVYHQHAEGRILLDPPYQRASVWTTDQRLDLMFSYLSGYPTGTLIFNDRAGARWAGERFTYAVVDGRQRLETAIAWFDGGLFIPATWLPESLIAIPVSQARDVGDGPYVCCRDLNDNGQRYVSNAMPMPVYNAKVATIEDEARIYRLVNSGGTPHTLAELEQAGRIEHRKN
jgi:hypothetical protein